MVFFSIYVITTIDCSIVNCKKAKKTPSFNSFLDKIDPSLSTILKYGVVLFSEVVFALSAVSIGNVTSIETALLEASVFGVPNEMVDSWPLSPSSKDSTELVGSTEGFTVGFVIIVETFDFEGIVSDDITVVNDVSRKINKIDKTFTATVDVLLCKAHSP